ncbi:MAG: arginine--tRNA ligase [Deltaproteobacteria bacterium]|nr:arginine--tRNA ligase [Deltaproteobacteria bacterium]
MAARDILKDILSKALKNGIKKLTLSSSEPLPSLIFEIPKNENHGDYSSNIALTLAPRLKQSPRDVAKKILDSLDDPLSIVKNISIAGPGFINFLLKESFWYDQLREIHQLGADFGKTNLGSGLKIQIEFVSANPTGPLHIGHGRGAALGDALANILTHAGYQVKKEYYLNDVGNQMDTLGRSVLYRYRELLNHPIDFPADHYQGEYIYDIARKTISRFSDKYLDVDENESIPIFYNLAKKCILRGIKEDLNDFSVNFDNWFSEKTLFDDGTVEKTISELQEKNYIYKQDGALWFAATKFGDDKDRVVVRANGQKTYFASDIGYHKNKFSRGFDQTINIWGADHHGYIPRMKAMVQALGYNPDQLRILLVQIVSLLRDGIPVAMSTRLGQFISLREVLDEVGRDAARYFFLIRRSDSPLDFDLELAKKQSDENPVYYVQYGHARLCSILRVAQERGVDVSQLDRADLDLLTNPEEISLIKKISHFPDVIEGSALSLEPHRITIFLQDLVSSFHRYYHSGKLNGEKRVITDQEELTRARLCLVEGLRITIKNSLTILGVSALERM